MYSPWFSKVCTFDRPLSNHGCHHELSHDCGKVQPWCIHTKNRIRLLHIIANLWLSTLFKDSWLIYEPWMDRNDCKMTNAWRLVFLSMNNYTAIAKPCCNHSGTRNDWLVFSGAIRFGLGSSIDAKFYEPSSNHGCEHGWTLTEACCNHELYVPKMRYLKSKLKFICDFQKYFTKADLFMKKRWVGMMCDSTMAEKWFDSIGQFQNNNSYMVASWSNLIKLIYISCITISSPLFSKVCTFDRPSSNHGRNHGLSHDCAKVQPWSIHTKNRIR